MQVVADILDVAPFGAPCALFLSVYRMIQSSVSLIGHSLLGLPCLVPSRRHFTLPVMQCSICIMD